MSNTNPNERPSLSCERPGCTYNRNQHAQLKAKNVARCLLCDCKGYLPATATPQSDWNVVSVVMPAK